ncbi:MAG: hypothetical protein ACYCSO_05305 [Cuniculiplasma sp.]
MSSDGTETLRRILGSRLIVPVIDLTVRGMLFVAKRFGLVGEVF